MITFHLEPHATPTCSLHRFHKTVLDAPSDVPTHPADNGPCIPPPSASPEHGPEFAHARALWYSEHRNVDHLRMQASPEALSGRATASSSAVGGTVLQLSHAHHPPSHPRVQRCAPAAPTRAAGSEDCCDRSSRGPRVDPAPSYRTSRMAAATPGAPAPAAAAASAASAASRCAGVGFHAASMKAS